MSRARVKTRYELIQGRILGLTKVVQCDSRLILQIMSCLPKRLWSRHGLLAYLDSILRGRTRFGANRADWVSQPARRTGSIR